MTTFEGVEVDPFVSIIKAEPKRREWKYAYEKQVEEAVNNEWTQTSVVVGFSYFCVCDKKLLTIVWNVSDMPSACSIAIHIENLHIM